MGSTARSSAGFLFLSFSILAGVATAALGQSLQLPTPVIEGKGTIPFGGQFTLGDPATTNITFTLQSSVPSLLDVPGTVRIRPGDSTAFFDVTVGDDATPDGDHQVTVTAMAPGFPGLTNIVTVVDNDPYRISFVFLSNITDTNSTFNLSVIASNVDGSRQTNCNVNVSVLAEGLEGILPLEGNTNFSLSQGFGITYIRVLAPGRGIRFRTLEYPGQSTAFTVVPRLRFTSPQPVADIAWLAASQTLLASVPANGGVYSNSLVAIDPATGLVTNSYPLNGDPSQMEASPDGTYLYVALDNRTMMERFDLTNRVAGRKFSLGSVTVPVRVTTDFCVPPGLSDSVMIHAQDGFFRYDSGVEVALPNFTATGAFRVEGLDYLNAVVLSPPLVYGNARALGGLVVATGPYFTGSISYIDGSIYNERGEFYAPDTFALLGSYPRPSTPLPPSGLPQVNADSRRVFYLSSYLEAYDRDLRQPLFRIALPYTAGSRTRFLSCGTNGLAYVTDERLLFLIPPDVTSPGPDADLVLKAPPLPPVVTVGTDYALSLSLSNAGPGIASIAWVTNAFPANVTVAGASASMGTVVTNDSAFNWSLVNLPPGSNATLQLTVRFSNAGWQTNTTWALATESDPVYTNNLSTMALYAELPRDNFGVFEVNAHSDGMVYDPVRDRLLLSVGGAGPGLTNGIVVFDPYRAAVDSFTPLDKQPSQLVRTADGQYLYVSLPADGHIRQLELPGLTEVREFAVTNDSDFPAKAYAGDIAAVPGAPNSIVVDRFVPGGSSMGLAVFDNGVRRLVTALAGYPFKVEFDTDTGALFALNEGGVQRCRLTAGGVSLAESYPQVWKLGTDLEYAGGQLFTTGGFVFRDQPYDLVWEFPGTETGVLVEPDSAANRVFYLVKTNGWKIRTFDIETRRPLGEISVPNVAGTPSDLIRWGTNGLAFRTSSNQLFLVRSPLVQPEIAADVSIDLNGPTMSVPMGSNAVFTLRVTNRGPSRAAALRITNRFSAAAGIVTVSTALGTWTTNNRALVWSLPELDSGTSTALSYTASAATSGVVTVTATTGPLAADPFMANNSALFAWRVGSGPELDVARLLELPVNDLVWAPGLNKLLLTPRTNAVEWAGALVSVDPVTWATEPEFVLGGDAGRLALSRDGAMLYAGVDFGIVGLTLPDLVVTQRFLTYERRQVQDLLVVPGASQTVVAVSGRANEQAWLVVYDDGTQRTNVTQTCRNNGHVFGDDPSIIYSVDPDYAERRYAIDAMGIGFLDVTTLLPQGFTPIDLKWGDGRLYNSLGVVVDAATGALAGTIPEIGNDSAVCYDNGSHRAFYLSPGSVGMRLRAFDGPTLLPVGELTLTNLTGIPGRLVRWGLDGFAFTTDDGQFGILRSSLVATNPPADVGVSVTYSPAPYRVGSNITAVAAVTNAGPNPATDVGWSVTLPAGATGLAGRASDGSWSEFVFRHFRQHTRSPGRGDGHRQLHVFFC